MISTKQQRRMAAKARRRIYRNMRDHMTGPHASHFDAMRRQLITPLFASRPSWEPPTGLLRP